MMRSKLNRFSNICKRIFEIFMLWHFFELSAQHIHMSLSSMTISFIWIIFCWNNWTQPRRYLTMHVNYFNQHLFESSQQLCKYAAPVFVVVMWRGWRRRRGYVLLYANNCCVCTSNSTSFWAFVCVCVCFYTQCWICVCIYAQLFICPKGNLKVSQVVGMIFCCCCKLLYFFVWLK